MNTARRIIRNFLSLSFAQLISRFIFFLAIIYLARILGPEDFGKINFAQAVVLYFILASNLGLTTLGAREVARNKNKTGDYVHNIVTLRLTLALLSFCLLLVLAFLIPKLAEVRYLIIIYGFSLFSSALLIEWVFQGRERMGFIGIARIVDKVLYGVLIYILIKNSERLWLVPWLCLAGAVIACGFLIYVFVRQFGEIKLSFNFSFWKSMLGVALPMGLAWMMIQIYNNFDTIMLKFMKGDEVVGWYNAAYKIIWFIFMLGGLYIITIFPVISRFYKESSEKLRVLLSLSAKLMITLGLPLSIGGVILAKPIIHLFYGIQYDNGIIAFQILIWYVFISFICMVYANSLLACNREKKYAIGVALAAATNLILNIFLIPSFGLIGAAVATVVAEGVLFIYAYREFQKVEKVEFRKYLLKPFVSALLMGIFLYSNLNRNIFLLISLGIVIYIALLFLLKGISKEELVLMKESFLKRG